MTKRRRPLDDIKDKIPSLARKPQAARDTKRDRSWEQRQRDDPETQQVALRGIPRATWARMKEIAGELGITASELARLFLESALEDYETGALEIVPGGREE